MSAGGDVDGGAGGLRRAVPPERQRINAFWLLRLRWGAVVGQLATIAVTTLGLGVELRVAPLVALIAIEGASNLALARSLGRARRVDEPALAGLMALDVVLLTGLFWLSGGAANPFTPLYLVYIALAAVVLRPLWTWSLAALALAGFAALFLAPAGGALPALAVDGGHYAAHGGAASLHLQGMWAAFGVGAGFIVYFVQRVTRALARREGELAEAQAAQARAERLASLATLAAGAAHELSTPLSTIAVVARELDRQLAPGAASGSILEDVGLIREQVERCREILVQMAVDAGETTGEDFAAVQVDDLVATALAGLPEAERVRVALDPAAAAHELLLPVRATAQALRAVVKNALQASAPAAPVEVGAELDARECRIEVRDSGNGMEPEILTRAFEPFFTTKPTGGGMGLGLFLARDVLERIGGRLELDSAAGVGTRAVLHLRGDAGDGARQATPVAGAAA